MNDFLQKKNIYLFRFQSIFYQLAKEISLAKERGGFMIPYPPKQAQISCHVNETGLDALRIEIPALSGFSLV